MSILRLALLLSIAGLATPAAAEERHILMLLYRGCEEACQSFQDYFRKHRLPVHFTLRDAAQDRTRIAGFVAEAKRIKPDLVVTWGTTVTQDVAGSWRAADPARHVTDIPLVFMIVTNPVEAGIVPRLESSGRNVTGTLYLLDEETQLRAARRYIDFRHLGILVNPDEQNSLTTRDRLRKLAPVLGYTLIERVLPIDSAGKPRPEELEPQVASLAQAGADLLYQSPDTFLNSHRDRLSGAAISHRLPVFSAAEAPVVKSGALMGVVNRYSEVGRLTARQAARILFENAAPAVMPIQLPRRFSFIINIDSARRLQRYPPLRLLDFAEIVGDTRTPANPRENSLQCD